MKKIIIITSAFISISCNTYKNTYDDYKTLNIVNDYNKELKEQKL